MSADSRELENFWQILEGYQRSNILFTFAEFDLGSFFAEKESLTAGEIAERLKIHSLAAERFLNACVVTGLLKREGKNFSNTELSEIFLNKSSDSFLGGIIKRHQTRSSEVWSKLTEKLSNWEYGRDAADAPDEADQGAEAMAEQHRLALLTGSHLAESFDFSKHKKILDLGGGTGAMSISLCKKYPHLNSVVFDLPENIEVARKFIERESLAERIEIVAGDFKTDALPEEFDVALLANFMAVADAEDNQKLLAEIYRRLPAGGVCLLSGWIIDDSHLAPPESVLFCLEDICWGAPDVERSEKVYSEWLSQAGFKNIRTETYYYPTKFLCGTKI